MDGGPLIPSFGGAIKMNNKLAAGTKAYIESDVRGWLMSEEIINAVDQQNIDHLGMTENDISKLDRRWRTEKLRGGGTLIDSRMKNDLSAFLRGIKAASGGVITEIFVMDNLGLNVGQTDGTGDYMQGDEAKWQKTYPVSASRDNSARLGAITIGINVDALK
jgi:hypothetical protein